MSAILQVTAPVMENVPMARDTYRMRFHAPEMAQLISPGQFMMVRLPGITDPLLGRPFALYDTVLDSREQPVAIDIVYLVIGKMTRLLARLNIGDEVQVWGPLGNSFPDPNPTKHVALVAGGIGQTPFLAHVRELLGTRGYGGKVPRQRTMRVSLFYGVKTADLAAGINDFRSAGAEVHLASDDGSLGYKGLVTQLLSEHPCPDHIFGCGPEPMLKSLAKVAQSWKAPCHLSLETPMACGIGICFSCVTRIKTTEGWDYRRVCTEGPIFDACELVWEP
jgi:dihydroorotate dehydrogenase electron transfer subunit